MSSDLPHVNPGWPALGWEERSWVPRVSRDLVSRAAAARHAGAYRAAVVPEIAGLQPQLPGEVLALAEDASNAIARFDAEVGPELAPFASVLLRSESASSSMIENLTSGARSIALAKLGSDEKRNATAIVGNVAAMLAALDLADHIDGDAILAMHRALLERNPDGGIHHVCYEVDDIFAARDKLKAEGARVLGDGTPKIGAHGLPVLFVHPKDFDGTLIELEEVKPELQPA